MVYAWISLVAYFISVTYYVNIGFAPEMKPRTSFCFYALFSTMIDKRYFLGLIVCMGQ